jgi:hypothetical protein
MLSLAFGESLLYEDVLSVDVAEIAQPLQESLFVRFDGVSEREITEFKNFCRLLSDSGQGKRKEARRKA